MNLPTFLEVLLRPILSSEGKDSTVKSKRELLKTLEQSLRRWQEDHLREFEYFSTPDQMISTASKSSAVRNDAFESQIPVWSAARIAISGNDAHEGEPVDLSQQLCGS